MVTGTWKYLENLKITLFGPKIMEKPGNRDFDQNIFGSKNVFVGNVMKRQEKLSFLNL